MCLNAWMLVEDDRLSVEEGEVENRSAVLKQKII